MEKDRAVALRKLLEKLHFKGQSAIKGKSRPSKQRRTFRQEFLALEEGGQRQELSRVLWRRDLRPVTAGTTLPQRNGAVPHKPASPRNARHLGAEPAAAAPPLPRAQLSL